MKKRIFQLYESLEISKNPICQRCINANRESGFELSVPVSPWVIGNGFQTDKNRVLFVGKVARGDGEEIGQIKSGLFRDGIECGEWLFTYSSWPYWSYTRTIIENLYGDVQTGLNNIAFTNLIKCNNSEDVDKTLWETKNFCLNELGVFWKELELLRPQKVVFYTNWDYDDFLEGYEAKNTFEDKTSRTHQVQIGAKKMPWWNRVFKDDKGNKQWEFLRVGHPERKKKSDFTQKIYEWIIGQNK